MTVRSGSIISQSTAFFNNAVSATKLLEPESLHSGWRLAAEQPVYVSGPLTDIGPVTLRDTSWAGYRVRSFYDDWYNRIHLTPTNMNFGAIVAKATQPLVVWNAYLNPVTLTQYADISDQGVVIAGVSLPLTIPALHTVQLTVVAAADGTIEVNGKISLTFDVGERPSSHVSGTRARLLDARPNWTEAVSLSIEYKTDVFTARDGTEQRRGLRQTPRRTISFTAGVVGENRLSLRRLLQTWQASSMIFGDPTRFAEVASGIASQSQHAHLLTVPRWLTVNLNVVMENGDTREVRQIQAISGNTVTFANISDNAWPAGALLMPALTGRLVENPAINNMSDSVANVGLKFMVDPGSDPDKSTGVVGQTYNSREVFNFAVAWNEDFSETLIWPRDAVDYGYGLIEYFLPVTHGTTATKFGVMLNGTDAIQNFIDFFCRQKGQLHEFVFPSNVSDMTLVAPIVKQTSSIVVKGSDIYKMYSDSDVYRNIAIRVLGKWIFAGVSSMGVTAEGNTFLTLNTTFDADYGLSAVDMVSWLLVNRFVSDALTIAFKTNRFAIGSANVGILPDLTPETTGTIAS